MVKIATFLMWQSGISTFPNNKNTSLVNCSKVVLEDPPAIAGPSHARLTTMRSSISLLSIANYFMTK